MPAPMISQQPEWLTLLHAQLADGKSVSQIARETGVARPSLSMVLNGSYPAASLEKFTQKQGPKILKCYRKKVLCPHLNVGISAEECAAHANAPMTMSNPQKLRHWHACQSCRLNPTKERLS